MELKDKISMSLSVLAIIISISVFVDGKITKNREAKAEERQNSYAAAKLGDKLAVYTVTFLLEIEGATPDKMANFKESIIKSIQDPQSYADQMGLRLQLSDLFLNYNVNSAFTSRIYDLVHERMVSLHTNHTVAVFECAYWASWCTMNARITREIKNDDFVFTEFNIKGLPKLKLALRELELPNSLVYEVNTAEEMFSMASELRIQLDSELFN
jgi:hypothetical protein